MCDNGCCNIKWNACCEKKNECCTMVCNPCAPVMNDCLAKEIECIWKKTFCDAQILPVIGVPSCNKCVMTLTHTLGKCIPNIKINGLCVKSMLANNSFYSAEVSDCKWVNLYKGLIPNIAGKCGCKSSGEVYIEALVKLGISVENDNYNWKGACPELLAINSKAIGMNPCEFSKKQIAALKAVLEHFSINSCCC